MRSTNGGTSWTSLNTVVNGTGPHVDHHAAAFDASGRFLPVEELRVKVGEAGIAEGHGVVSYCGSGVTACHNLLMLEHAGFGVGRLYPGSWSQYAATDLPAATGS